jgi:aubergine-like protein
VRRKEAIGKKPSLLPWWAAPLSPSKYFHSNNLNFFLDRYNQKTYRIERIDFGMSPSTTFDKQGTQVSYQDYYKTRYNETISDPNQPLLINKDRKTGNEVALIPELCQLTGLTDAMRADFRLMKDLA